jgi:VIT1/CCC1 family predicted Fe2+/Mn2+ transporter
VSNTCLVFGVAGAQASPQVVLTTGVAGLLAGAFSMAAGEYVSMRSQRELYESQLAEEREELARYPDEEAEELALIYAARGWPLEQARRADEEDHDRSRAHARTRWRREELGLDPLRAGLALGRGLGLVSAPSRPARSCRCWPFLASGATHPELLAAALSGCALFAVGVLVALFSGRSALAGGLRMFAIGAAVGLVTYGIGRLVGAEMAPCNAYLGAPRSVRR